MQRMRGKGKHDPNSTQGHEAKNSEMRRQLEEELQAAKDRGKDSTEPEDHDRGSQDPGDPTTSQEPLGGRKTPEIKAMQVAEMDPEGSKCQTDQSDDAHLHFQNHDASQQGAARGSPEVGKKESKKQSLSEGQDERIKRHKEIAWKRKNGVEIQMHPIHQQWCKSEKEHCYTRGVQSFLKK